MRKSMRMVTVLIVAAVVTLGSGCAWFQSVDKATAAYNVGKYGTVAYMQAVKGKLPEQYQAAVTKVWEGFRDNADKVKAEDIDNFPVMVKTTVLKSSLPDAMKVKAIALVDKYWADLNAKVALTGMTNAELIVVMQALKQGIQDGLNATNPDDNQPPD